MLSDLKYSLSKSYVAGGMPEVEAIAAADGAVANALGLTEAAGFDVCTFDPLAQLWGAQLGTARRRLVPCVLSLAATDLVLHLRLEACDDLQRANR